MRDILAPSTHWSQIQMRQVTRRTPGPSAVVSHTVQSSHNFPQQQHEIPITTAPGDYCMWHSTKVGFLSDMASVWWYVSPPSRGPRTKGPSAYGRRVCAVSTPRDAHPAQPKVVVGGWDKSKMSNVGKSTVSRTRFEPVSPDAFLSSLPICSL